MNYVESILVVGPWKSFFCIFPMLLLTVILACSRLDLQSVIASSPNLLNSISTKPMVKLCFLQHDHCNITCHTMEMQWKWYQSALEKDINMVNG
jgi:hypothetical protein